MKKNTCLLILLLTSCVDCSSERTFNCKWCCFVSPPEFMVVVFVMLFGLGSSRENLVRSWVECSLSWVLVAIMRNEFRSV